MSLIGFPNLINDRILLKSIVQLELKVSLDIFIIKILFLNGMSSVNFLSVYSIRDNHHLGV